MADSDQQPPNDDDEQPERGDPGKLFDDPAHLRGDGKMLRRAIEKGWYKPPDRWELDTAKKELIEKVKSQGDLTIRQLAQIKLFDLLNGGPREVGIGERVAVSMDGQNQKDQINNTKTGNDPSRPQHVTRTPDECINDMDDTIPDTNKKAQ